MKIYCHFDSPCQFVHSSYFEIGDSKISFFRRAFSYSPEANKNLGYVSLIFGELDFAISTITSGNGIKLPSGSMGINQSLGDILCYSMGAAVNVMELTLFDVFSEGLARGNKLFSRENATKLLLGGLLYGYDFVTTFDVMKQYTFPEFSGVFAFVSLFAEELLLLSGSRRIKGDLQAEKI